LPDRTLLIISQVYVPDPASVGQHMHDAAAAMVRRGWRVVVLASARGYDDPSRRYPARETIDGVTVRRFGLSSFGKSSIAVRLAGAGLFLLQAVLYALFVRRVRAVLVSTSPPMCSAAGLVVGAVRRAPVRFWAMDINPDQLVALGKIAPRSLAARAFDALNRTILRRADAVVALDRYMAERLAAKAPVGSKIAVIPPWPHVDRLDEPLAHERNPFRREHGLEHKFVFMYSGNLSPSHPITTFLDAALRLRDRDDVLFLFVGGGLARLEVERVLAAERPRTLRLLPYQPLERLHHSLSAADVHLVSMGDEMVGIVHPCKVYGAMAVGRPVLFLGPERCHVADILAEQEVGWQVRHGDAAALERLVLQILGTARGALDAMGRRAQRTVAERYSKERLCRRFCDVVERGAAGC
jgi:glycosyltransferase involved in cell wall biosynthesis